MADQNVWRAIPFRSLQMTRNPDSAWIPKPSAKPGAVPGTPSYYDHRIDFFRGLSLIFIFINHIPDNALTYLTSRTITLFDSAEVFMFLAGYSAALSYYRFEPYGIQALARKALGRVRAMMTYHLILMVFVITASFAIARWAEIPTGYEVFLEKIESNPTQALLGSVLLGFQAPLLDILPMYMMVMLLAPFMVWLMARSAIALLTASVLLWMFASRFFPAIPTITYDVYWSFNPFCWQFLFAIGLVFGWRTRVKAPPLASGEASRVLDICCGLFVIFSACVLMTIAFQGIDLAATNRLRAMYFSLNKQCLDLWRVVGLLATAYFMARLIPKNAGWLTSRPGRMICAAGAASLPIFALTVVLSFTGKFVTAALGSDVLADSVVTACGIALLLAVAALLREGKIQALRLQITSFMRDRIGATGEAY